MLGTFPKDFSQVATSQAATFRVYHSRSARPSACSSSSARPLDHPNHSAWPPLRRLRGLYLTFEKLTLGKIHIWEVVTWEIVTWEVAFGKMPLGNYLTPYLHGFLGYETTL